MSLISRISQLEARQPPKEGKWHSIVVESAAEAEVREAEMRASGELGPDDDVFCIILTSPGDGDMTGPMVRKEQH